MIKTVNIKDLSSYYSESANARYEALFKKFEEKYKSKP